MTPKEQVLRKYPTAHLEKQTDPQTQAYILWKNTTGRMMTEDMLGCGATPRAAYKDAAEMILWHIR